ncbi:MAG: hypothetical protein QOE98_1546 [Gaiellaceae bacterium]|nr:hypothetical protein [Gaiellaceae bacterium]
MSNTTTHLWPTMVFHDAPAAMQFLQDAFGFEELARYTRADDPSVVEHGELRWPAGGGIMVSSAGKDDSAFGRRPAGVGSVYIVCDDPVALLARATAVGADIVRGLVDEDYGSRGFTVSDPEGNLWSFGTYAGAGA